MDKWVAGLRRVTLSEWKDATLAKVSRIGPGARQSVNKMASFMSEFLPFMDRIVTSLPPRGGLETNIERATAVMRGAAEFRRSA